MIDSLRSASSLFRNRRPSCLLLALLFALAAPVSPARASFFNTFGVTARGMALGNAMAAISKGWGSVYYNPAALALSEDIEFSVGVFSANPSITAEHAVGPGGDPQSAWQPRDLENITGPAFGLVVPIQRLTPKRLPMPWAIGLGIFVPRQALTTTTMVMDVRYPFDMDARYPFDVVFQKRNQTLALHFGISTRITSAVYIGLGLASQIKTAVDLASQIKTAVDLPLDFAARNTFESTTRFSAPSLLGGILVRPSERLRIGLVYRQESKLESRGTISVRGAISVPGYDRTYVFDYDRMGTYVFGFVPENVSIGGAYRITERWRITGEVTWNRWSSYSGPLGDPLKPTFKNTLVPRIGVIYRITRKLKVRGGFYYEPTPVTNQETGFYPIGNDRFVPSIGAGYTFDAPWGILAKPVTVDGFFQYHFLKSEEFNRRARSRDLTSSGSVYNLGVELTFRF
jgi:long-chain fatty acid transport protein